VRTTSGSARELTRRAHDRAKAAIERAERVREHLRQTVARLERPELGHDSPKTVAMFQLAAEESARSVYEKDRFLAVVSHELRQPLTAAQAALQVLDVSQSDAQAMRARSILRRQLAQMSRLVDDLLEISRYALQSSQLSKATVDLRRIIEAALETTAASISEKDAALSVTLPDEPLWLEGDEVRLLQVFTNLVANAVRYTPAGGRIAVTARSHVDLIVTEVADTGRGIAAADLDRVFEPFARGSGNGQDGFGIGLALVRGIIERHGGSVAVVSDGLDRGSRFTVVLPAGEPPAGR
jgi:signal transduction histidine kinase